MARSTRSGGKRPDADETLVPESQPTEGVATPAAQDAPETTADPAPAASDAPSPAVAAAPEAVADEPSSRDRDTVEDAVLVDVEPSPQSRDPDPAPDIAVDSPGPDTAAEAPAPRPVTMAPATPAPRRASVVPLLLGGAVAAALGYGAAWTDLLPRPPDPVVAARLDELAAAQAALQGSLDALAARPDADADARARLDAVEAAASDLASRLDAVDARAQALGDEGAGLAERLKVLEDRPQVTVALSEQAQAAVESQIAALRQEAADGIARVEQDRTALAEQADARMAAVEADLRGTLDLIQQERAALEAARAAAAAEAQANRQAAAAAALRSAIDSGAPYAQALEALTDVTGTPAPPALADLAAEGIPTLAALREAFGEGARAALEATLRAQVAAGEIGRFEGFWRIQSGVRSLTPRAGDDPDAILSRAEAALVAGDVDGALTLVAALPEVGRAALEPWAAQAEIRRAAMAALAAYGDS